MNKPTLVVVNSNYPNENNKYGDVFVHSRLKHYVSVFNIRVVGWKKRLPDTSFTYEGIHVDVVNTSDKLVGLIRSYQPDAIGFHFVEGWMFYDIIRPFKGPVFIWVHGSEALGWYRRLFQFNIAKPVVFLRYIARNTIQMFQLRQLINYANTNKRVHFIFVSKWMRSITEADTAAHFAAPNYIPNPIDPNVFSYHEKSVEMRKRILLIRSFDSKKYANDLAIEAILKLKDKPFFNELSFSIYGKGKYFAPLTGRLKDLPNVSLHNYFLENKEIPSVHIEHGVFLCPTRQDAQGVSMCEAMSSGLVPISSHNTAIPEFVTHGESGFMSTSADEIAAFIELLYNNPDKYLQMSKKAAEHIRSISSTEYVVKRELELIQAALPSQRADALPLF
jgi:L-malate glycosyltransferase